VTDSRIEGTLKIHNGTLKPTGPGESFQSPKLHFHFFVIEKFTGARQAWALDPIVGLRPTDLGLRPGSGPSLTPTVL